MLSRRCVERLGRGFNSFELAPQLCFVSGMMIMMTMTTVMVMVMIMVVMMMMVDDG